MKENKEYVSIWCAHNSRLEAKIINILKIVLFHDPLSKKVEKIWVRKEKDLKVRVKSNKKTELCI